MTDARPASRILVVNSSRRWREFHPHLDDQRLVTALDDAGLFPHEVPIPIFGDPARSGNQDRSSLALRLLPYAAYGDAVLGLGHESAFIKHDRRFVVVDDRVVAGLGAESSRRNGLLARRLTEAECVFVLSPSVDRHVLEHTGASTRLVCDAGEIATVIGGSFR